MPRAEKRSTKGDIFLKEKCMRFFLQYTNIAIWYETDGSSANAWSYPAVSLSLSLSPSLSLFHVLSLHGLSEKPSWLGKSVRGTVNGKKKI